MNRTRLGKRRADAAIALWQLGDAEKASDVLKVDKDPESLTQFVHRCKERGVQAAALWDRLANAKEDTVRYGLLLALGEFSSQEIPRNNAQSGWRSWPTGTGRIQNPRSTALVAGC